MTENPDPAQHPRDPERHRDKLLAWLIDAFALAMGALAIFRYKPDDTVGALVVFVGAYTLTSLLQGANWASLAAICESLVFALAPLIHLGTVATVPASFTGL